MGTSRLLHQLHLIAKTKTVSFDHVHEEHEFDGWKMLETSICQVLLKLLPSTSCTSLGGSAEIWHNQRQGGIRLMSKAATGPQSLEMDRYSFSQESDCPGFDQSWPWFTHLFQHPLAAATLHFIVSCSSNPSLLLFSLLFHFLVWARSYPKIKDANAVHIFNAIRRIAKVFRRLRIHKSLQRQNEFDIVWWEMHRHRITNMCNIVLFIYFVTTLIVAWSISCFAHRFLQWYNMHFAFFQLFCSMLIRWQVSNSCLESSQLPHHRGFSINLHWHKAWLRQGTSTCLGMIPETMVYYTVWLSMTLWKLNDATPWYPKKGCKPKNHWYDIRIVALALLQTQTVFFKTLLSNSAVVHLYPVATSLMTHHHCN